MKLTIFAEEAASTGPETKAADAPGDGTTQIETGQLYQGFINKIRSLGGTKKSLNTLVIEWHRYTQQYPIPHIPAAACLEAFNDRVAQELEQNTPAQLAKEKGRLAYCAMLPKLADRESIRDFIACVVQGMAVGIFPGADGTRLLYGAQVAQAALPPTRRWRKTAKTSPETAPKCTQTAPKQPSNSAEPEQNQSITK